MSTVDLSVLIVTYNSRAFIGDCIAAVRETVHEHTHEIIVVDNASSDETAAYLRHAYPEISVIQMGRNAGFSAANNRAFSCSSGRTLLLLNGDAIVQAGALDDIVRFLDSHSAAGVVAPRLEHPDGSDQGTARSFPTPAAAVFGRRSPVTRVFPHNRFSRRYLTGLGRSGSEPFQIDWVSGACLLVRRDLFASLGGLDESFFMYWEDADFCRRVKTGGFEVWCVPSASVRHAEGSSSSNRWPARQVRHFHTSAYRYYAKHHLHGGKRVLRPIAASALAARAGLVMTRELARADTTPTTESHAASNDGAVEAGELV
jgi:GT2 family glycosyltransferase